MVGRINNRALNANIDTNAEKAVIKKFPGATAKELAHYSVHALSELRPFRAVIVAGTNDLNRHNNKEFVDPVQVVRSIITIGLNAKGLGVKEIVICGITVRQGPRYRKLIPRLNMLLQAECLRENFLFVDMDGISYRHLADDGLHLNHYGSAIMKMNILKVFNTFNPFFNDFIDLYDKAI